MPIGSYVTRHGSNLQAWGSSPPTSGRWSKGDIVWNNSPTSSGPLAWVCIQSGEPGTWKPLGPGKIYWGTAAPETGTWERGDIVFNSNAAAGAPIGWMCVSSGTPGTWLALPNLPSS